MDPKQDTNLRQLAIQIRDIEIIYDALTSYYWKGSVLVYTSFNTLPRGRFVPDCKRIILKEESYDVMEQGGQRYPLRLLVRTPEQSSLVAQFSSYPDTQTTFLIYPEVADINKQHTVADSVLLVYVYTSERDRKLCCPYTAGSSLLLMNTELSQVMGQDDISVTSVLLQEVFPSLPLRIGFRKLDQSQLHGFVLMKEMAHPSEPHKTRIFYWSTAGMHSRVQLTMNVSQATRFRVSPACDDKPPSEGRLPNPHLKKSASVSIRGPHALGTRAPVHQTKLSTPPSERKNMSHDIPSCCSSLPISLFPPESHSVFVQDSTRIWSALNRYIHGLGREGVRTYFSSNTLLPYYPPQKDGASTQELQVPLENRRAFKARAHNETKEGFPNLLFVNQETMTLTTNKQSPRFQSMYLVEFTKSSQLAMLCYVFNPASRRHIILPSYQEEIKNQLKITTSENLAPLLDGDDTEQAVQQLMEKVLPLLIPGEDLENCLFNMQGMHDQFLLLKPISDKHYYWKIRPEAGAVNVTTKSTEAAFFQLNVTNS